MLQKLLLTVFLALCIVVTFTNAFNLRSDDKSDDVKSADALSNDINDAPASKTPSVDSGATGNSDRTDMPTGSAAAKEEPDAEANKWLTPAEKLVKDDKIVAGGLQKKYEMMTEQQNKIRAMLEARIKQSESGDQQKINKLVAEASEQAFERYKNEIAKHVDVIYERIKPKIEETCINLGFQRGAAHKPAETGAAQAGTGGASTGGAQNAEAQNGNS